MFECWEFLLQMWWYKFSMIFSRDLKVHGACCGYEFLRITADSYADHYKSFEFPWSCWKLISLIVKASLLWKLKFWNSYFSINHYFFRKKFSHCCWELQLWHVVWTDGLSCSFCCRSYWHVEKETMGNWNHSVAD